jgi:hypothetical protein
MLFSGNYDDEMTTMSRVLENLKVHHLAKKFTAFYGIQKFITVYSGTDKSSLIHILMHYDTL